ncbi:uncharacterized protein LOC122756556 [Drosophila santomea]|uniref:uncharacterized protein LOC122756556 n=1 Tax=Drosophila santomea TaxID=129105 RepID=UPI001CCB5830|nr:uncharacterized protein LOC122756556 [Drosophila santomea]
MKEYRHLGHMSAVPASEVSSCRYFLPLFNHCVIKEDSSTTKLRVVFKGSAAPSTGYSPNDVLMAGPVIQPKLFHILIRFRSHPVAVTGDICKMYRCVRVSQEYLQCIVWRDSAFDDLQEYKLDTVTYGTRPASVRAVQQLSIDEQATFPIGSEILRRDFYVDDLISGSGTDAISIMQQTAGILAKGKLKLRKLSSNIPLLLEGVPAEDKESFLKFEDGSDFSKTLGLAWDPASDQLLFSFSVFQSPSRPCRRTVLSALAKFYDPLGQAIRSPRERLSVAIAERESDFAEEDIDGFLKSELAELGRGQGTSTVAVHKITMKDDQTVKQRYYPKNTKMQVEINAKVD